MHLTLDNFTQVPSPQELDTSNFVRTHWTLFDVLESGLRDHRTLPFRRYGIGSSKTKLDDFQLLQHDNILHVGETRCPHN